MLKIIGYICTADSKKIFSFDASEKTIDYFGFIVYNIISEEYSEKAGMLRSLPCGTRTPA